MRRPCGAGTAPGPSGRSCSATSCAAGSPWILTPHGLRLRGARIAGRLDLENLTTGVAVELYDCLLGEGLVAHGATLPFLILSGCRLEYPAQPPLDADRLTATALGLDR